METLHFGGKAFKLFIDQATIDERVREMAKELTEKYSGLDPVFLVVLNGAFRFAADLSRGIGVPSEWKMIQISSYKGLSTTGKVKIELLNFESLTGKHVIIVEDIVDTGLTMEAFLQVLDSVQPASIFISSLLVKPEVLKDRIKVDQIGFSIPNRFVIGYGLDYDEKGREVNGIWEITEVS